MLLIRDSQGTEYRVTLSGDGVTINDRQFQVERLGDGAMRVAGPRAITAFAAASEDTCWIFVEGDVFTFDVERGAPRRKRSAAAHGSLAAPMPATVRRVEAQPGQTVRRGEILIVLEAMKMELPVRAPADGTVAKVNCREGELVQAGQELVELQP